jgi:predicted RNA-binding Zn-ribbon protein involved in translation (DUF1610 family)
MANPQRTLREILEPAKGAHVIDSPPVLSASTGTHDFVCGNCGIVLMEAADGQVHGVLIHCTKCGATNTTDA